MKNKKAIFFTILVIAMLSLFLMSYAIYSIVKSREAIQKRITTLNNFVFSMEKDLPRKLYISGFRIIFLFEKHITETGSYIDNVTLRFNEVFFNGTFYGVINDEITNITGGTTFLDMVTNFRGYAAKINADANLTNPSLTVSQEDPWNVKVTLKADLFVKDNTNLALWNKTTEIVAYIPIEHFEDPLYVISTGGKVTNKIKKTVYEPFVQGADVSNLTLHVTNSSYINSTSAPSFLDRLEEGKTTVANVNGIESLVFLPKLSAQGIAIEEKSVVDYIYFNPSNNPSKNRITGMPDWFILDDAHLDVYGVGGLAHFP